MGLIKNIIEGEKILKTRDFLSHGKLDYPNRSKETIDSFISFLSEKEDKEIFDFDFGITLLLANIDGRIWAAGIYDKKSDCSDNNDDENPDSSDNSEEKKSYFYAYNDDKNIPADEFLAIRCGAVAMGEFYYDEVRHLIKIMNPDNKFIELLEIPAKAWALKHNADPSSYPYESPNKYETFSDRVYWGKLPEDIPFEYLRTEYYPFKNSLQYFAENVVKNEEIWTAISEEEDDFVRLIFEGETDTIIPIWPTKEHANMSFKYNYYDGSVLANIGLFEFLEEQMPYLNQNRENPAPFLDNGIYLEAGWSTLKRVIVRELLRGQEVEDADPRVIFSALGRGELRSTSANYALNRLIEKDLIFDEREVKAFSGGANLKTVAYYYEYGWPDKCERCEKPIDYSEEWDVAFGGGIVCSNCFDTYEKDSIQTKIALVESDEIILHRIETSGFDDIRMITELRENYLNNSDIKVDRINKPIDDEDGTFDSVYLKEAPGLLDDGKIVYGSIFRAVDPLFFEYGFGDRPALPADIIYSMDSYYDENSSDLYLITQKILSYKGKKIVPIELQGIVKLLDDGDGIVRNVLIPKTLTDGREVYITSTMILRNQLPMMKICGRIVPILADSSKYQTCIIVPKRHWPREMLFFTATPEARDEDDDGNE